MPVSSQRRPRSHSARALTWAGLLLAVSQPALAQSFIGRGAPRVLAVPDAERAARPAVAVRAEAEPAAPPALPPLPQRPFPALSSSLRLSGEESALQWPVYLTEAQSREHLRLRIGYLAAISVVPDASFLTAKVNGTAIGRSEIKAPGAIRIIEFDIPADLLKPGYNALEIDGVQRHRVDCSLDATYELWTQIDPAWTGLVSASGAAAANSLRDLPAIAPDARGIVPIRIVLRNRPGFATFERLIGLVQRLALAGNFSQVAVEFAGETQGPAGLDIHVAEADAVSDSLGRQPLTFEPAQGDRAARITLAGDTPAEIEAASRIVSGIATREPMGSPQGLRALALARGVPTQGRETLPFSAFGLENREFGGRLFRTGFDLTLPTDFVPADYDKVALTLAGGYAAGLELGAQIIVDVNGRNVASVPMANAGGALFRDETIALPLSRWRPGRNKVEVKALLPAPSDRACEGGSAKNRFLLLDRSTLAVPRLARAIRLPDLAATLGGGLPKVAPGQRPRLVVPAPDRESMAAAATLAVQMALSADKPIDFELTNDRALEGRTPTVVVGPARSLDPAILRTTGLDPDQIRQIWQGRAATPALSEPGRRFAVMDGASLDRLRNDRPPACALPAAGPRPAGTVGRSRVDAAERRERDVVAEWNGATASQDRLADQVATMSARLGAAARESWAATKAWAEDQVREPEIEIGAQASLIVSQGLPGRDPNGLLTVFTAPSAATLQASALCLTTPSIWNRIEGRVATLDANDGSLTNHAAKQARFVESGPMSLENLRLVVAGWFSTNPSVFTLILFAAAISLGLSTSAMLRGLGRANPGAAAKSDNEGTMR
ncbi:cellulose biosynthesis cyclic di-GMP-binding regulatory protein BcsB [Methylobacterium sp. J-078]|uniref:cellulose biosynthesis cyclic di-GMP-binding regulatory protein BcsB n=1 Tax=Methylobacterium sp. J-078 TaxID=2836657 RepID=UPI001FB893F7|nr:cellulose biosynthesis cyclic di-GMP-binding regulatory protein BcsB [Methylobacterium sp. J-078]MCJ2047430.1 cellulose biosynthesis cyclic di-GMP-binding regulatory protein BcsB [Methylobacterium sp. J-078]